MTKVKEWIKRHKEEIIYGAEVVGTVALTIVFIKTLKVAIPVKKLTKKIPNVDVEAVKLSLDGIDVATIISEWSDGHTGEFTDMILDDFKLGDMGKLGDALIDYLPNVDKSTEVTGIFGILVGGQD